VKSPPADTKRLSLVGTGGLGKVLQLDKLGFEVGDAVVGEAEVGAGAFESFLQLAVLLGELVDAEFEGGVLGGQMLDGLAGNHLVEVAELSHPRSCVGIPGFSRGGKRILDVEARSAGVLCVFVVTVR